MESNNTDIAVNWFMALPFDERIAIANKYYPQYAEDNTDLEDAEIEHIYFSEYPIMPDSQTWWKGLNEEEQTKLCQKHFQGIPVESLMERSIKVMFHYENPLTTETTTNTVTGSEWYVEYGLDQCAFIKSGEDTFIASIESEDGKGITPEMEANANRIVNCVNNFDSLVSALKDAQRELDILKGINKNEQVQEKLTNINQRLVDILTKVNPNW